ncbi:hypothetical protein IKQ26_08200 [bacterium]|nr:hypothetical protein [bacterium]
MSLSQIRINFIHYLQEHNLLKTSTPIKEETPSVNIFTENYEYFKDFLLEQLSKNPEDFIEDFKIIENMDFTPQNETLGAQAEGEEEEGDLKTQLRDKLLETIYNDTEVIKYLDEDGNGVLSDSEKAKFEAFVKGEGEELTVEALQQAYEAMKAGTFTMDTAPVDTTNTDNIFTNPDTGTDTTPTTDTTNTNPGNNNRRTTPTTNTTPEEEKKDYSKMSETQLNSELTAAQTELSTAQSDYSAIMSGSNPELQAAKENIQSAYETYQAQVQLVDETLAGELDKAVQAVNEKESELDTKSLEVSSQKTAVSQAETAHANATQRVESLTKSKNAYAAIPADKLTDAQKSQKASIQAQLNAAIEAEKKAEQDEKDAKDKLKELEDQETALKGELETLKTAQSDIETTIAEQHPEVAEAQKAYDDAKTAYDTQKSTLASAAQEAVTTAQDEISQIQSALNTLEVKKTEKTNNAALQGDYPSAEEMNITAQYIPRGQDSDLPYLLIGPNPPEEGKEYPVLVFCPGGAQYNAGENAMYLETTPGGVMFDHNNATGENTYNWDLQGFNGYIVIPQLNNTQHWNSEWTANQVASILDNLTTNHNITRGKTVLAGASMGVAGVSNIGRRLGTEYFDEAVFISGNPNTTGFGDLHASGYYAELGEGWARRSMTQVLGRDNTFVVESLNDEDGKVIKASRHSSVIDVMFNHDDDNNGFSDFLEKFFPEYYHK